MPQCFMCTQCGRFLTRKEEHHFLCNDPFLIPDTADLNDEQALELRGTSIFRDHFLVVSPLLPFALPLVGIPVNDAFGLLIVTWGMWIVFNRGLRSGVPLVEWPDTSFVEKVKLNSEGLEVYRRFLFFRFVTKRMWSDLRNIERKPAYSDQADDSPYSYLYTLYFWKAPDVPFCKTIENIHLLIRAAIYVKKTGHFVAEPFKGVVGEGVTGDYGFPYEDVGDGFGCQENVSI